VTTEGRPEMLGFFGTKPGRDMMLLPPKHEHPVLVFVRQTMEQLRCDWCGMQTGTRWHLTFPNHHVERVCRQCRNVAAAKAEQFIATYGDDFDSSEVTK